MGEALESATNAVAAVQNMSDRIKTIPNGPAPDADAELCRLFTFVYNNNFLSQLENSNLDVWAGLGSCSENSLLPIDHKKS